jgi:hypothetical protein
VAEHGFHKAGAMVSNPIIGCYFLAGGVPHNLICGKYIKDDAVVYKKSSDARYLGNLILKTAYSI